MKPSVLAGLAAGVAVPAYGVYLRYRRDMNAARARLAAVDRHVISTRWGALEYARAEALRAANRDKIRANQPAAA